MAFLATQNKTHAKMPRTADNKTNMTMISVTSVGLCVRLLVHESRGHDGQGYQQERNGYVKDTQLVCLPRPMIAQKDHVQHVNETHVQELEMRIVGRNERGQR